MFGSHLSIAGGLHNALTAARDLGMDCVQVFTKNQKQWKAPPLTRAQIDDWRAHRESTGISSVVSHDSYLINLCSAKPDMRQKSVELFAHELTRCEALDIPWLVTHPGSHMGQGEAAGLRMIAEAINALHQTLGELRVVTCLEVTAGQGSSLGYRFEHLASIIEQVDQDERLGICLDTAHLLAAGYDLTSAAGARSVLRECDRLVGLERVKVLHLNDSKVPRGKRVDRHEHIGHGHVALEAFEVIVNHPKLRQLPMILETAKEAAPDGRPWDTINLETLQSLQRKRPRKQTTRGRKR
jgi:deoxyribonuclease-4